MFLKKKIDFFTEETHNEFMDNTSSKNKVKRGRPSVTAAWPTSKFTFKNLLSSNQGNLCASSLRNKIRSAKNSGEIQVVDKLPNNMGRPELVYEKRAQQCSPSTDARPTEEATLCQTNQSQELTGENTL